MSSEDMDACCKHLESFGICSVHKLIEHSWGQRIVRFYDPDGHIIRFAAQGLSPEETAVRMGIPLDFVVSRLNGSK